MIVPRRGILQIHPLNSALAGCGTHSGCPDLDEHTMNLIVRKIILNILCDVVSLPEATGVRDRMDAIVVVCVICCSGGGLDWDWVLEWQPRCCESEPVYV